MGPFFITAVLPNNTYHIRSLRASQDLVVHYGRPKPGIGNYNRSNINLIPADDIPITGTVDITTNH